MLPPVIVRQSRERQEGQERAGAPNVTMQSSDIVSSRKEGKEGQGETKEKESGWMDGQLTLAGPLRCSQRWSTMLRPQLIRSMWSITYVQSWVTGLWPALSLPSRSTGRRSVHL